ncbi:MHYT domain-containing protein [Nostoc sp.]|uniref:MHYT domain-containing protein n=1 Tax=Nostoc sp. TaxID=1180 RepID=UPI003593BC1D
MPVSYDLNLVALSVIIAVLSAYTSVDLTERIAAAKGWAWIGWLIGGATSFGIGIWSMHFVGMLAFHLTVPVSYNFLIVLISVLPAILSSGFALWITSRKILQIPSLLGASLLMGMGITTMHYTGIAAMQLPAIAHYDLKLVTLSVGIAVMVSLVALWLTHYLHNQIAVIWWQKIGAAALMGMAVPMMHYTGMAAVCFSPIESFSGEFPAPNTTWLSSLISAITFFILGLALVTSSETKVIDRTKELSLALKELQQSQLQLIQTEKMSSLGELVAGIAHEINNPVNFICANLHYMQENSQHLLELVQLYQNYHPDSGSQIQAKINEIDLVFVQEDLPKVLDSMKIGSNRIIQIVRSLRNFSRFDEVEDKAVDIHDGIDSTLLILQHRLKGNGDRPRIEVIKNYGVLPEVNCYLGQMNQVFMNLLANAIDALNEGTTQGKIPNRIPQIQIATEINSKHWLVIRIADNGIGIPERIKQRLFEPLFTTKPVGKGTGLGLSIAHQIVVQKHNGTLEVNSQPGIGTEFTIAIPIISKSAEKLISV